MITVVAVAKGRGNYYDVALSNGEKIKISEDTLVRHRLLKDSELTEEVLTEIKNESREDVGFQLALNYLSYQMRTEKEVRTYLKDKEILLADRNQIITRLKEINLLDDLSFAESFVRTQVRLGDKGPKILQQKLKQKGVSEDLIEQALFFFSDQQQLALAEKTAEKALAKLRDSSLREASLKIRTTLLQKGFSADVISQALETVDFSELLENQTTALASQAEKFWRKNQRLEPAKRRQKVKQSLYQKGFPLDEIDRFLAEKEAEEFE